MMLPVRHPRFWLLIGWALVVGAITVCLLPGQKLPKVGIGDKFEHVLLYLILTVWFTGVYPRSRYVVIALSLLAMGISIEFVQGAMHLGRTSDVRDVFANSAGIVAGVILSLAGLGGWAQRIDGWTRDRESVRSD